MKTIYPFVALLSAASVAAGPLPRFHRLDTRSNDLVNAPFQARTEHLGEAAPAPAPAPTHPDAEAEKLRLAEEKAGKNSDQQRQHLLTGEKLWTPRQPPTRWKLSTLQRPRPRTRLTRRVSLIVCAASASTNWVQPRRKPKRSTRQNWTRRRRPIKKVSSVFLLTAPSPGNDVGKLRHETYIVRLDSGCPAANNRDECPESV